MTTATTPSTNEQLALRALELASSGDRGPAVEEIVHPEFITHRMGLKGPDGFREVVRRVNTTFADITITPLDVISSGDKVVARTRLKALHVGPFMEFGPTNRTLEVDQMHMWRIEDGLIAEHWVLIDDLSALRQMGAL